MQLWLLAAHARGALPLVGAAWGVTARKANHNWGVTARKANHNASNARGVTAGKMVCVSVKYRQTWHAYIDRELRTFIHVKRAKRFDPVG